MAKTQVQKFLSVLSFSGSMAGGASTAGSVLSDGYSRILGIAWADASGVAASGLRISQSPNSGSTWNFITACGVAASASSGGYSIEVVGNAVEVRYVNGATVASNVYLNWRLRPLT